MNTKIIGIVLAVVVIVGGGFYIYKANNTTVPVVDNSDLAGGTTQTMDETQPAGKKMAFSELLKQGGS